MGWPWLRAGGRVEGLDAAFHDAAGIADGIGKLYGGTKVLDASERTTRYSISPSLWCPRRWPCATGRIEWRVRFTAASGVAPDANSTLRASFAQVKGYEPSDAVVYSALSTLPGMLEKYTGKDPFDRRIRKLATSGKWRNGGNAHGEWKGRIGGREL